ncbi:LysR family transcriptional regulator [Bradyrhizobium canariense]|uniref:LysR family transcriptional regulator n=1 Tax=Bradyrhizobium canariense TaxID=255045 RepID=A0A1X3HBI0_9BRAD|nr:LysR family transcriptional regulator [Bradyrhizobium canariense]OSI73183.1 LysR family transcriptional regulator [Bradyrhizobium canariense]OSI81285.1 LysR family transcriptional regulator [Bradyrhizobium canariense]OSI94560.1 LysR family transcriptional regulator [Bradyrhizobium canariense]OSI95148.1 LysR family transcriptional regulator [Bradyrhizobium canariense]OSJ08193.1 LysR family transcriptional regulator [Bradyrhizobium canariense]
MHKPRRPRSSVQARKVLELKHLRSIAAAADCGSFRGAAELLRSQQSSISRRICEIEYVLGFAIFERYNGGVRSTRAGRDVLRLARTILEEFEALIATARAVQNSEIGRLSVGLCTSLSAGHLQTLLLEFKEKFPQIELVTVERPRTRLAAALRNGALDVLIVTGSRPLLNTEEMRLWSERVLVALPPDHPLAGRDIVYWADLRGETVLLSHCDPERQLEHLLFSKLLSAEDRPKIERHDVSPGAVRRLISMHTGISLVLESDMAGNLAGLTYRELRDAIGPSRFEFSASWCGGNKNPALQEFLDLLSERYSSPRLGGR